MPRYIDAELFSKNLMMQVYLAEDEDFTKAFVRGMELVKKAEEETPTADVQEVKHGRWLFGRFGCGWCSECGECGLDTSELDAAGNYCPNCGAKMDLEPEERKKFDEQIH